MIRSRDVGLQFGFTSLLSSLVVVLVFVLITCVLFVMPQLSGDNRCRQY